MLKSEDLNKIEMNRPSGYFKAKTLLVPQNPIDYMTYVKKTISIGLPKGIWIQISGNIKDYLWQSCLNYNLKVECSKTQGEESPVRRIKLNFGDFEKEERLPSIGSTINSIEVNYRPVQTKEQKEDKSQSVSFEDKIQTNSLRKPKNIKKKIEQGSEPTAKSEKRRWLFPKKTIQKDKSNTFLKYKISKKNFLTFIEPDPVKENNSFTNMKSKSMKRHKKTSRIELIPSNFVTTEIIRFKKKEISKILGWDSEKLDILKKIIVKEKKFKSLSKFALRMIAKIKTKKFKNQLELELKEVCSKKVNKKSNWTTSRKNTIKRLSQRRQSRNKYGEKTNIEHLGKSLIKLKEEKYIYKNKKLIREKESIQKEELLMDWKLKEAERLIKEIQNQVHIEIKENIKKIKNTSRIKQNNIKMTNQILNTILFKRSLPPKKRIIIRDKNKIIFNDNSREIQRKENRTVNGGVSLDSKIKNKKNDLKQNKRNYKKKKKIIYQK